MGLDSFAGPHYAGIFWGSCLCVLNSLWVGPNSFLFPCPWKLLALSQSPEKFEYMDGYAMIERGRLWGGPEQMTGVYSGVLCCRGF